jgi:hypothetical protein
MALLKCKVASLALIVGIQRVENAEGFAPTSTSIILSSAVTPSGKSSIQQAVFAETVKTLEYDDFLPNPNSSLKALDVVKACMDTLLERQDGAGLEVCFNFSSDRCRVSDHSGIP